MKRHQHITKLQSELIKEKKLIDLKLDEAIAKQCYFEKKLKYQLLPKVVIPTIASNVKITKVDKHQIPHYTQPLSHHLTPSKPISCNTLSKRPLSDTEKANMKKIQKDVVTYNFHNEIDVSQLLAATSNST